MPRTACTSSASTRVSEVFPDDPDVVLYNEVMAEEAPDAADTDFSRGGFGTIMNIHDLLDDMDPASLTHESVLAAFKATTDQPSFLNVPYSCSAPPVANFAGHLRRIGVPRAVRRRDGHEAQRLRADGHALGGGGLIAALSLPER